jgi:hypothetical protein
LTDSGSFSYVACPRGARVSIGIGLWQQPTRWTHQIDDELQYVVLRRRLSPATWGGRGTYDIFGARGADDGGAGR